MTKIGSIRCDVNLLNLDSGRQSTQQDLCRTSFLSWILISRVVFYFVCPFVVPQGTFVFELAQTHFTVKCDLLMGTPDVGFSDLIYLYILFHKSHKKKSQNSHVSINDNAKCWLYEKFWNKFDK